MRAGLRSGPPCSAVEAMDGSVDLLAQATDLCATAGRPIPVALTQLAGGKNNRVFRLDLGDGSTLVFKSYHADPRDPRDRLGAEWAFLNYVWGKGVRAVPQPLARARERHAAIYSFVPGRKLAPREIAQSHIDQAADFIVAANATPRELDSLAPASEACFSLADHVATVDRRVARLAQLDPLTPYREQAEALIAGRLVPGWERVRARLVAEQDHLPLPASAQCASPSDFGFHNALVDEARRAVFIDFEYAGRDDPAKLVCDFFCCPEIPVPLHFREGFVMTLAEGLHLDQSFVRRCEVLLDAYRIKWTCIVLNDFLPLGAARRDFAQGDDREARCAAQLDKAASKLSDIGSR